MTTATTETIPVASEEYARTAPDSLAGRYVRSFWQPVALSSSVKKGKARVLRVMGESFTLFRTDSGLAQILAERCAHRGTKLSSGRVEGEGIRCFYHGWKYGVDGQCLDRPAETAPCNHIRIASYPTHEWMGLVFGFLGNGVPPPFPTLKQFEEPGVVEATAVVRPFNYFNQLENTLDEVHINFVHQASAFSSAGWNDDIPVMRGEETDYGIKRVAGRGTKLRTSHLLLPNVVFGRLPNAVRLAVGLFDDTTLKRAERGGGWMDHMAWRVPIDDESHLSVFLDISHVLPEDTDWYRARKAELDAAVAAAEPAEAVARAIIAGECDWEQVMDHPDLLAVQDIVAMLGQAPIASRRKERLGRSDQQIVLLRRLWQRDLQCIARGESLRARPWPEYLPVTLEE